MYNDDEFRGVVFNNNRIDVINITIRNRRGLI